MRLRTLLLTVVCLVVFSTAVHGEILTLKLADGVTWKCEVVYVGRDMVTVDHWLDSAGDKIERKRLRWDEISPESAEYIRAHYGVAADEDTERWFFREGDVIHLATQELIGWISADESTEEVVVLYTADLGRLEIERDRIKSHEKRTVDIRKCLPPELIYHQYVSEHVPVCARDHLKIAVFCERIKDFPHAIHHYKKAVKLDARLARVTDGKVAVLRKQSEEEFAWRLFERAKTLVRAEKFVEAAKLIDRVLTDYPDTRAADEAKEFAELNRLEKHLEIAFAQRVVADYYEQMNKLLMMRLYDKVIDGESEPGFRVRTKDGTVEGMFCDENGKRVHQPTMKDIEKLLNREAEARTVYVFVKDWRGTIYEIRARDIRSIKQIEMNKKRKKATFMDHLKYLTGKNSRLHRDVRRRLWFKYGLSEGKIRELWQNRAYELKKLNGDVIIPSLAQNIFVNYGRGTMFSPKLARKTEFRGEPLRGKTKRGEKLEDVFESLPTSDKMMVLKGIMAESSLEIIPGRVTVTTCPKCKGDGIVKLLLPKEDDRGREITEELCEHCHGTRGLLSFWAR